MTALQKTALLALAALLVAGKPRPISVGEEAPTWSLRDLQGRRIGLEQLRGRVVVVNVWATWCAPCAYEMPQLARFWRQHRDHCLDVVGIATESGAHEEVSRAVREMRVPYTVVVDEDGSVADRYRVPGYPTTFVIDAKGKVRKIFDGVVERPELEAAVKPLLAPLAGKCSPVGGAR